MNNIKLFELDHLKNVQLENKDKDYCQIFMEKYNTGSFIFSIYNQKEELVTFAGIDPVRQGVGEVWIVRTNLIDTNKKIFNRSIKYLIQRITNLFELHRMQMTVIADNYKNRRWASYLGFEAEGILRNYDPGEDYIMYSRLA